MNANALQSIFSFLENGVAIPYRKKPTKNRNTPALLNSITTNTDLVAIHRFGMKEINGGGALNIFVEALEMGRPILTIVESVWSEHWMKFGGGKVTLIDKNPDDLSEWISYQLLRDEPL